MTGQRLLTFGSMLKGAVNEFLADNCPHLAASISYYFLLSLFPMTLAAISIFGIIARSDNVEQRVTDAIVDFMPVSADYVARTIHEVSQYWPTAGIIAIIGFIWAGMAVFNAIRKSLNTAWGIRQPRPFLHERALEFAMMTGLGLLILSSIGISTLQSLGPEITSPLGNWLDSSIASVAASTVLIFLGFFFLYRVVPNAHVPWRYAFFGALVSSALFQIVTQLFIWFTGRFTTYHLVYGTLGVIITLMAWTYLSSIIMLFCAKMISKYPEIKAALAIQKIPVVAKDTNNNLNTQATAIPPSVIDNSPIEAENPNENRITQATTIPSPSVIVSNIVTAMFGNIGISREMKTKEDQY